MTDEPSRNERVAAQYKQEIEEFKTLFRSNVITLIQSYFEQAEAEYAELNPEMNGEDVWCEEYAFEADEALEGFMTYMDTRFNG